MKEAYIEMDIYKNLDLSSKGVWFPIVCSIIVLIFLIFMPKRLTRREIFFTYSIVGFVALILDVFIIADILDFFDMGDKNLEGLGDMVSYAVVAPGLSVIFLNFYKEEKRWLYIAIFTAISFFYEVFLSKVGYLKLLGWNSLYSIPIEFVFYAFFFPWLLKLIRRNSF